jgi:hypothetical protein
MPAFRNLTGQRFSCLIVLHRITNSDRVRWLCRCDCGECVKVQAGHLQSGHTRSCGCLKREKAKIQGEASLLHGHAQEGRSPTYESWRAMKERCTYSSHPLYHRYGGRGVKVCDSWASFANFLADMGERPEGYTISRLNHDGDYEPSNCEWAPKGSH